MKNILKYFNLVIVLYQLIMNWKRIKKVREQLKKLNKEDYEILKNYKIKEYGKEIQ